MPDIIKIEVEGIEKIEAAIKKFPREVARYMSYAAEDAIKREIYPVQGLRKYPPATEANSPPTPYYIRGRGMQVGGIRVPEHNLGNSEKLGTQWYVTRQEYGAEIGNRASYAPYVHGDEQARWMARIGWRKLTDVVDERLQAITKVYQVWVDKMLSAIGF